MKRSPMPRCLLPVFLALCVLCNAAGPDSLKVAFERGNAYYQSGDFPAAERAYRSLLEQGVDSGTLYYNLGNACFKQKKLGEAIYFWEKASRILPGDAEILENLQFGNLLVVDRIDVPEDPLPVRALSQAIHMFTPEQESRIVLALFLVANLLFTFYLLVPTRRLALWGLTGSLTAILLTMMVAGSLTWKVYQQTHRRQGVVVEQKVDVRSGPGGNNITVVTVHEGVVVRVRGESNGWVQISLPNGWTGWLPGSSVRIL